MDKDTRKDLLALLVYESNNVEYVLNVLAEQIMLLEDYGEPDIDEVVRKCNQLKLHADRLKSELKEHVSDESVLEKEVDVLESEWGRDENGELSDDGDLYRDNPVEVSREPVDTERYR